MKGSVSGMSAADEMEQPGQKGNASDTRSPLRGAFGKHQTAKKCLWSKLRPLQENIDPCHVPPGARTTTPTSRDTKPRVT